MATLEGRSRGKMSTFSRPKDVAKTANLERLVGFRPRQVRQHVVGILQRFGLRRQRRRFGAGGGGGGCGDADRRVEDGHHGGRSHVRLRVVRRVGETLHPKIIKKTPKLSKKKFPTSSLGLVFDYALNTRLI